MSNEKEEGIVVERLGRVLKYPITAEVIDISLHFQPVEESDIDSRQINYNHVKASVYKTRGMYCFPPARRLLSIDNELDKKRIYIFTPDSYDPHMEKYDDPVIFAMGDDVVVTDRHYQDNLFNLIDMENGLSNLPKFTNVDEPCHSNRHCLVIRHNDNDQYSCEKKKVKFFSPTAVPSPTRATEYIGFSNPVQETLELFGNLEHHIHMYKEDPIWLGVYKRNGAMLYCDGFGIQKIFPEIGIVIKEPEKFFTEIMVQFPGMATNHHIKVPNIEFSDSRKDDLFWKYIIPAIDRTMIKCGEGSPLHVKRVMENELIRRHIGEEYNEDYFINQPRWEE